MTNVAALIRTWLLIDFFGDARRAGKGHASSLTTTIFTQSFFAFVFAALLYPETPPVPFAAANLCLSSLLIAIGALGDESRPERRAADDHLLTTSPMSRLRIALARSGHAAFSVMLVTIGMALPPAILLAFVTHDSRQAFGYLLGACACSGLACGALGLLARVGTRWLGAGRTALLMGSVKALLLGGGLVLFAIALPRLQSTADALPFGRLGTQLLPPYQVARWLAAPSAEAWRPLLLLASGLAMLALATLIGGVNALARTHTTRASGTLRILRRLTTPGPHRAIAEFVATGMWRSAGFRTRVLPLLGVPAAMVLLTMRGTGARNDFVLTCVLMQLPAIYLPFLVVFLPRADQPGTAWIFAHAPRIWLEDVQDATWRALVTHVLLPVFAIAMLLACATGASGLAALPAALFALGVAVLSARVVVRSLMVVPFTEAREGDRGPEFGSVVGNGILLGGLGTLFGLALPEALRWPVALVVVAVAVAGLARRVDRREGTAIVLMSAPDEPASDHASPTEPATDARDPAVGTPLEPPTLRRELRAIAALYAFSCLLPLAVGTIFAA